MHTSKAKNDNLSILVSLDINIWKTRCASERYMGFNMWNKHQNLRNVMWDHCNSSGPIYCSQRLTFQQQLRAVLSWVLSISKDGDPQHFCATCSTLMVILYFLIWSWNFLFSCYAYSRLEIALWHLKPAENSVLFFQNSALYWPCTTYCCHIN